MLAIFCGYTNLYHILWVICCMDIPTKPAFRPSVVISGRAAARLAPLRRRRPQRRAARLRCRSHREGLAETAAEHQPVAWRRWRWEGSWWPRVFRVIKWNFTWCYIDLTGFYSDLMGFYGDFMGFYSDLMGFHSEFKGFYRELKGFYSDWMGYWWDVPSGKLRNWFVVTGTWLSFFPYRWECHHPNWQTHIFQRGWNIPPTRNCLVSR